MNRRQFTALALAVLATPLSFKRAMAAFTDYQPESFVRLISSGAPVVVHVHADWCPVCRAQIPVMNKVLAEPGYKNVRAVRVNFDKEQKFLADYKVVRQSTILIFKGGKEIARLSYETDPVRIEQTLARAIS